MRCMLTVVFYFLYTCMLVNYHMTIKYFKGGDVVFFVCFL